MKLALDYDETFTEDPIFWKGVIELAKQRMHSVTFVTFRSNPKGSSYNDDIYSDANELGVDVVFTSGEQKAGHFDADVWIDDMPVVIPHAQELLNMYHGCVRNDDTKPKGGW